MVTISIPSLWATIWLLPPSANIPAYELVPRLELLGKRSLDILEDGYAPESAVNVTQTGSCDNLKRLGIFTEDHS
ncbi:10059_t:CDS:2, partial [Acaulospora colombiana]